MQIYIHKWLLETEHGIQWTDLNQPSRSIFSESN